MGRFLTCRVPISKCVCVNCQGDKTQHQISEGNLNLLYTISIPKETVAAESFKVQVDIIKIKWIHDDNGGYIAKAQMKVRCPKCDKDHEIDQIIETPRLFFEKTKKCDSCGGNLSFQEEELEIEDQNGMPFVHVSGKLICEKCNKSSLFTANTEIPDSKLTEEMHDFAISCGKGETIKVQF